MGILTPRLLDRTVEPMVSRGDMDWLHRVFWLSGSPCGGKSSVSTALAERFGWNVYHVDEHWEEHCARADPERHPIFSRISRLTGDDLWLRPIEEQIRTEPLFVADTFPLILEDVEAVARRDSRSIIVDASVVPASLAPILPSTRHVFYLIPEERFQRHHYSRRPSIERTLAKTSDRERAFSLWMARDAAYARWLESEVESHGFSRLKVDGTSSLEETTAMIGRHFGGSPSQ